MHLSFFVETEPMLNRKQVTVRKAVCTVRVWRGALAGFCPHASLLCLASGQRLTTLRTASVRAYLHAALTMQKWKWRYQNSHSSVCKAVTLILTHFSWLSLLLTSSKLAVLPHFVFRPEIKAGIML